MIVSIEFYSNINVDFVFYVFCVVFDVISSLLLYIF